MTATPRRDLSPTTWLLVCLTMGLCAGCKLTSHKPRSLWPMDVATQAQTPAKMAAIWSDTVLYTAAQPPTRGFGGRIYFYDERSDAIKVDGKLIVYVYDDDDPDAGDRPSKRFVFNAEQFAEHYSGSELGPSYSVWIPWDEVGGPTKQLSLVPFFLPSSGGLVAGEHTRHRLPGVDRPGAERRSAGRRSAGRRSAGRRSVDRPGVKPPPIRSRSHGRGVRPRAAGSQLPQQHSPAMGSDGVRQVNYNADVNYNGGADRAPAARSRSGAASPSNATMRTTTINIPRPTQQRLVRSETIPREQRTYVAGRFEGDTADWNYFDRARFNASRAAEYRDPRFTRQRTAPWEQPEEPTPAAADSATAGNQDAGNPNAGKATAESRRESAAEWAERYRQRWEQRQGESSSQPLQHRPQARYERLRHRVPAEQLVPSSGDRVRWPPAHAAQPSAPAGPRTLSPKPRSSATWRVAPTTGD